MVADGAKRLPEGWEWKTLNDVADINYRDPQLRNLPDNLPVSFVPMAAVDAQRGIIAAPEVRLLKEVRKGFTPFSNGDVIMAKITPSMENGKAAIARNLLNGRAFGSTEFHVFKPKESVLSEFLFYFIRQESFRKDAKAHFAGTAGQLRVPASFLFGYPFPLPPLSEQERIVSRIEELFSALEAGVAALERVRAGLRRYKASVLKAAVEGKLLENRGVERSGQLPEGWRWVTVGEIGDEDEQTVLTGPFGSNLGSKDFQEDGVPVLTIGCLTEQGLNLNKAKYISEAKAKELERYKVREGDFLFSRMATVGRAGLVTKQFDGLIFNYHLMRLRLDKSKIDISYFLAYVRGSNIVTNYVRDVNHGATRDGINTKQLLDLPVILPPLEEQRRIVGEVERRLSVAREVESAVEAGLARAARLRQAVLRSAFEGRL